ncbi:MAG: hypothetical protein ACLFVJ_11155 [Persicimonas sp.]
MTIWPWDIDLAGQAQVTIDVCGRMLSVERLDKATLRYQLGDDPANARLIGVSETDDLLRFVPTLGPIPLLVFPETPLLSPAGSTVRCVMRLPLHLQVGVGTQKSMKRVDEIVPPGVSKALYGPVDAGTICTSIRAPNSTSVEAVEELDMTPRPPGSQLRCLAIEAGGTAPATRHDLVAYTHLRARNKTDEPLTISKVMIPAQDVSLYQAGGHTHTNEVSMRLSSAQEAEIDFLKCPVSDAAALVDLNGARTDVEPKKRLIFAYAYRSKTGLEYGF